ncbi:MAG TPA: TldD/PmbA family protein [Polyangiaceae bacterium]
MSPGEIAAQAVELIKKLAPGAEGRVSVDLGRTSHTRFAANEITTAGDVELAEVSVTVARGKRHATAAHKRLESQALAALVKRAAEMAQVAPEDPEWMGVLGPGPLRAAGTTFDASTLELASASRAVAAKKAIAAAESQGAIAAGFYLAYGTTHALATTAGLTATHPSTVARLTMTARSADGSGSGWAGTESVAARDIDAQAVATTAVDKAVRSQKPGRADPKPWKVVLDPACVVDLLRFFFEALDARSADEGRSFFAKRGGGSRIGEKMFASALTLKGDPFDPATPASPFDQEGLAVEPVTYIEDGTLKSLITSRYWAQKTGRRPSPHPTAVHLVGGDANGIDDLVGRVDRGLYITRFWYTRWLDPQTMTITGLTRDGVFLIERGALKGPVNNFRFNESPAAVLARAKAWTKETVRMPSWGPVARVPAILTEDFHMASISAAV